jgi:hypothetical protein
MTNIKTIITLVTVVMAIYTAVAVATVGRFSETHAITVKTECTDCHQDAMLDVFNGKHISSMSTNQTAVIDNFLTIKGYTGNSTGSDKQDFIQGLCYSCHVVEQRNSYFGFQDFFMDSQNNVVISGVKLLNDVTSGDENESIKVNITLVYVTPANASVSLDASVQLINFSGQQNHTKLTTNIHQPIAVNESATILRDNVYGDYYRVFITANGNWEQADFSVGIEDSSYPFLSMSILNGTSPNCYTLPNDFRMQYYGLNYFHTNGSYNSIRVPDALSIIKQNITNTTTFQYALMNETVRNSAPSYSCSVPDTMCHINQKITDLGQKYGVNGERFYNHDMQLANMASNCNICHI